MATREVLPLHAQVALLDRTWQDYPEWETGDEAVAYRSPSLIHPDEPPYPGFAVATRPDFENGQLQKVRVELWIDERPDDLELVHRSVLAVGSAGVSIGNGQGDDENVLLPRASLPIEIYTDCQESRRVSRVVFALTSGES